MTDERVLEVLKSYEIAIGTPAKKSETNMTPLTLAALCGHLSWMCQQVPGFLENGQKDKAQRWIGFIQGSMWSLGMRTIDQMREDNRL